jgi:hypothetical protein
MYCKTCIYREGTQCTNPHIREDNFDDCDGWDAQVKMRQDSLVYSYCEMGWFDVGPDFGCVHHKPVESNL